ncbi:MAG: M14 family metallopeptidase [Oscillospiraceae bacterium]|nr:M14 family metallopeptidase [Oscillospiraceae bacterium]
MREELLFRVDTPYRRSLPVKGWYFGDPQQKSLAVMGSLRGNEIQQMYVCSLLIQSLVDLERQGLLAPDAGILVVPCANQFSMNVGRRFWAADNTDINRMFPGYDQGETTQRIAGRIFTAIQGYTYGVHLTSFYLSGDHLPHVRIMATGYEQAEEGLFFGLPYVVVRHPQPYDTTTLNYNWQIWNTQAFSLYTPETESINQDTALQAVQAILRFLYAKGLCLRDVPSPGVTPEILQESCLHNIISASGGLLLRARAPGDVVKPGQILGDILDPCGGQLLEHLRSDCTGRVFFARKSRLIDGHEVAFRILPDARCRVIPSGEQA